MKQMQSESEFVEKVRQELDRSVTNLDPGITARLGQSRRKALRRDGETRWSWLKPHRLLPAAAVAAAMILVAVLLDLGKPPSSHLISGIEDVEILASGDNPDFFQELDFYHWLAEEMDRAG